MHLEKLKMKITIMTVCMWTHQCTFRSNSTSWSSVTPLPLRRQEPWQYNPLHLDSHFFCIVSCLVSYYNLAVPIRLTANNSNNSRRNSSPLFLTRLLYKVYMKANGNIYSSAEVWHRHLMKEKKNHTVDMKHSTDL